MMLAWSNVQPHLLETIFCENPLHLHIFELKYRFDSAIEQVGFPRDSDSKESACNMRDLNLIPGGERSPGGEHGNPLQFSCLENLHRQEPGGLQSTGSQRVRPDLATKYTQQKAGSFWDERRQKKEAWMVNMQPSPLPSPGLMSVADYGPLAPGSCQSLTILQQTLDSHHPDSGLASPSAPR